MIPLLYVLAMTASAKGRLEIQDARFAEISEGLLDSLRIHPGDGVVELGIGAGSFARRILPRLAPLRRWAEGISRNYQAGLAPR
jgi:hypothetical protein